MVSLATDEDEQGPYFLGREATGPDMGNDEVDLLASDVHLASDCEPTSKPIRTEFVAVIQMILITIFFLILFLFPYVFETLLYPQDSWEMQLRQGVSVIIYAQITTTVCLALMERYLHLRHRESLRLGYLEFYRETQRIKRIPSYTFAAGNAVILLSLMVTLDLHWDEGHQQDHSKDWLPVFFLQMIGTVECGIAWIGSIKYAVKVFKFNKRHELPDVEKEEAMAAAMQPNIHIPDVGFRDTTYVDNLLEKQADLIHYLKQHTVYLNRLIIKLKNGTAQNQQLNSIG